MQLAVEKFTEKDKLVFKQHHRKAFFSSFKIVLFFVACGIYGMFRKMKSIESEEKINVIIFFYPLFFTTMYVLLTFNFLLDAFFKKKIICRSRVLRKADYNLQDDFSYVQFVIPSGSKNYKVKLDVATQLQEDDEVEIHYTKFSKVLLEINPLGKEN